MFFWTIILNLQAPALDTFFTSLFQRAIVVKTIIIGHAFLQKKFCEWCGEGTKFCNE